MTHVLLRRVAENREVMKPEMETVRPQAKVRQGPQATPGSQEEAVGDPLRGLQSDRGPADT